MSGFEWNSKKLNRVFLYASLLVKREILIRAKNTTEEEEEGEEDEEEEERTKRRKFLPAVACVSTSTVLRSFTPTNESIF